MTKTQANEPGFVDKLEADSLDAIVEVIGAPRLYNDGKSAMRKWFLNRLRAAAPLVPAPAYRVKALETAPKAWITEHDMKRLAQSAKPLQLNVFPRDPSDISGTPYVALAAIYPCLDCLGEGWALTEGPDDRIVECPSCAASVLSPVAVEEADAKAGRVEYGMAAYLDQFDRSPYSTPSPQIGNAGAGPVGEAVALFFEREGDPTSPKVSLSEHLTDAAKRAGWTERPLYAHPVEEPDEVKQGADYRLINDTVLMGMARDEAIERAETAEAALTETRGLIRDAIGLVPLAHQNWHTDARAALTGDAQEGGK